MSYFLLVILLTFLLIMRSFGAMVPIGCVAAAVAIDTNVAVNTHAINTNDATLLLVSMKTILRYCVDRGWKEQQFVQLIREQTRNLK